MRFDRFAVLLDEREGAWVLPLIEAMQLGMSTSIVFVAEAESANIGVLHAVCEAVQAYIKKGSSRCSSMDDQYVYQYIDPLRSGSVFYCGKGKANRWRTHFDDPHCEDEKETAKIEKIQNLKNSLPTMKAEEMAIIILGFNGQFAEAQAFAVEHFMIQAAFGTFGLTNLTRGNTSYKGVRWIAKPFTDPATRFDEQWTAILEDISNTHQSQDGFAGIQKRENAAIVRAQLPLTIDEILRRELSGLDLEFLGFDQTPEHDLTMEFNHARMDVCLQLLFSFKELGCRINLRPKQTKHGNVSSRSVCEKFVNLMRSVFGDEAQIRNPQGRRPFLKPYAKNQNGHHDVFFPIGDLTSKAMVHDCLALKTHHGNFDLEPLTLREAVIKVIERMTNQN